GSVCVVIELRISRPARSRIVQSVALLSTIWHPPSGGNAFRYSVSIWQLTVGSPRFTDSLRYYPAYEVPGRAQLAPQDVVAARHRMQLLLVQRADGSLTIGDTHEYDEPFAFDVDEDAYRHLAGRAAALLGTALPPVQRRWAGVYCEVAGGGALYHRSEVAPGVVLVTGAGGRGMTCSPAIAE